MKKLVIASLLATSTLATSAHAWGDREQGALAGVVGFLLLQQMHRQPVLVQGPSMSYHPRGAVMVPNYQPQAPIYAPQVRQLQCWQVPVRDLTGAIVTYAQQCF